MGLSDDRTEALAVVRAGSGGGSGAGSGSPRSGAQVAAGAAGALGKGMRGQLPVQCHRRSGGSSSGGLATAKPRTASLGVPHEGSSDACLADDTFALEARSQAWAAPDEMAPKASWFRIQLEQRSEGACPGVDCGISS